MHAQHINVGMHDTKDTKNTKCYKKNEYGTCTYDCLTTQVEREEEGKEKEEGGEHEIIRE